MKKNPRSLIHSWLLRHPFFNPFGFSLSRFFRILTSTMRTMPDFIIIGYTKSGSTALYDYLIQHPNITQAARKEIHFFDISYWRGHNWYRSYFPIWEHFHGLYGEVYFLRRASFLLQAFTFFTGYGNHL